MRWRSAPSRWPSFPLGRMRYAPTPSRMFTSRLPSGLVGWMFARTLLRGIYADKILGERMVRESGLDWTIAQPAGLTNGPRTGRYQAAERLTLSRLPKISRADVAHFLLEQIEDRRNVGKTLVMAY